MLLTILQDIFYYPIFNVLMFLYWVVRDFGLSIVLLTILVRLALVPMTFKQLRSQRKMMEIQPHIARLKAEYGDDKQGFAKAQMALMKENNVSMLGGCLPLLIQLPFLYGLFYALESGLGNGNPNDAQNIASINKILYPFMHFANLTLPGGGHPLDTYLHWFSWLPGNPALNLNLADPTHILPILAGLFTFIQVRMMQGIRQQQKALPGADPKTVAQQNIQTQTMGMMTYITPLFTLFFAWRYAAGLSLYWTVGTLFAVGQQYFIYGWGGLFKGIPRLEQWAAEKNAAHDARREARLIAKGAIPPPAVVESTLAPANGAARNGVGRNGAGKHGTKAKDWIEQAKGESGQDANKKARANGPRPFPTLMKPKETARLPVPTSPGTPKPEPQDNGGSANGSKNGVGAGAAAKRSVRATPSKLKTQPTRRGIPPRSGSLPKPKGGKK